MADLENNSSSEDSDDEFLTSNSTGCDREALVRKKLLENFYGKAAVAANFDDHDHDDEPARSSRPRRHKNDGTVQGDVEDLDSPNFDAKRYAEHHIRTSPTHDLLETEERLALQVRNLDSTMQTLVYENYSRFIDATDAIKSINVNVEANEEGLKKLTSSMNNVSEQSRSIEQALGTLRDQVADKIRIQRLLSRLDALLKLPVTLQTQIENGKYKSAAQSYRSTATILARHSEGFESLKSIETECSTILENLQKDLQSKLLHWSGRVTTVESFSYDDNDEAEEPNKTEDSPPVRPPKELSEVFECAGALYFLQDGDGEDLFSMAIAASMRLLDRLLDSHLIEVQERRFGGMNLTSSENVLTSGSPPLLPVDDGSNLIPHDVLDAVLEGATLYKHTFGGSNGDGKDTNSFYLIDFVSEAFSSFLAHVKSILLEESSQSRDDTDESTNKEETQREVSGALSLVLRLVQDFASGLVALRVNADFAAKLVDQAMDLAESMVRRNVNQKFHDLRLAVAKDCLLPFADKAVKERELALAQGEPAIPKIVQLASSALSDCLQLVDDVIRSIFSDSSSSDDLKDAVRTSTLAFTAWLANSFEILAGGDPSDATVEAPLEDEENDSDDEDQEESGFPGHSHTNEFGAASDREMVDMMETSRARFMDESAGALQSDFILSIVELCRISVATVPVILRQSFATQSGTGKKKARGIFPSGEADETDKTSDKDDETARHFKLAASRVLFLYVMNRGMSAADSFCLDLEDIAVKSEEEVSETPSASAIAVLCNAKATSLECSIVFGGQKRAGPVPEWKDDALLGLTTGGPGRKTGLQLDVERMFKEHVTIYPHPEEVMEASTNAVLFLYFKIVFRALFENCLLYSFAAGGFQQLQVDAAFLKHMIPHYVSTKYSEGGTNACSALETLLGDVLEVAGERCTDRSVAQDDGMKQQAHENVRSFITSLEGVDIADQFIIPED